MLLLPHIFVNQLLDVFGLSAFGVSESEIRAALQRANDVGSGKPLEELFDEHNVPYDVRGRVLSAIKNYDSNAPDGVEQGENSELVLGVGEIANDGNSLYAQIEPLCHAILFELTEGDSQYGQENNNVVSHFDDTIASVDSSEALKRLELVKGCIRAELPDNESRVNERLEELRG